ncbi:hypothetical protein JHK87_055524 [Glycine soja]|nr:hypothetical protein JHK87_055524 [Glycine soja]
MSILDYHSVTHIPLPNKIPCLISIISPIDWNGYFSGISHKTQELYSTVFVACYLDLFMDFIYVYNTFMKVVFIASFLAIVWCMSFHLMVRRSYNRDRNLTLFTTISLLGQTLLWHSSCMKSSPFKRHTTSVNNHFRSEHRKKVSRIQRRLCKTVLEEPQTIGELELLSAQSLKRHESVSRDMRHATPDNT